MDNKDISVSMKYGLFEIDSFSYDEKPAKLIQSFDTELEAETEAVSRLQKLKSIFSVVKVYCRTNQKDDRL